MMIRIALCFFFLNEVNRYNIEACELKNSGLTTSDKAQLVDVHNRLRAKVANGQQTGQPSAADMKQMKWDDELAAKAQEWANTCQGGHDLYDGRKTSKYPVAGQNFYASYALGTGSANKINLYSPVQAWYGEVKDFDRNAVKSYKFDPKTGHYSQVVWANTEAIGCGYVLFPRGSWTEQHIICNYGPAGNFIGQPVYLEGTPASRCRSKSTQYLGLCSS
uniref:Cysteine-rich venom protein n=1 Tax=Scolopendra mojiangica (nomen nudum) TaxID=2023220 RepID=A0A5B9CU81_9MYRI|nr:venom allergen [Scolopendra mojiangica (nomen nudum)]